eukprot:363885-Chlamydomonas_euryale.AAC.13
MGCRARQQRETGRMWACMGPTPSATSHKAGAESQAPNPGPQTERATKFLRRCLPPPGECETTAVTGWPPPARRPIRPLARLNTTKGPAAPGNQHESMVARQQRACDPQAHPHADSGL